MLFMAGSLLFAIGSFPAYAQLVDPGTVGITFVVGSLFFTSAGYSAFLQAINPGDCGFAFVGASVKDSRAQNLPASFVPATVGVQ